MVNRKKMRQPKVQLYSWTLYLNTLRAEVTPLNGFQHLGAFKPFAWHVSYLVGLFTPQKKHFCQGVNKPSTQLTCDANDLS